MLIHKCFHFDFDTPFGPFILMWFFLVLFETFQHVWTRFFFGARTVDLIEGRARFQQMGWTSQRNAALPETTFSGLTKWAKMGKFSGHFNFLTWITLNDGHFCFVWKEMKGSLTRYKLFLTDFNGFSNGF